MLLGGCGDESGAPDAAAVPPPDVATIDVAAIDVAAIDASSGNFSLAGTVTFDHVNAADDVTEGGPRLDYAHITARPARRVVVSAMENGAALVTGMTDDAGAFSLDIPAGHTVTLRVAARSLVSHLVPDQIAPDRCAGASWDLSVLDNTHRDALYVMESATTHAETATGVTLHAGLAYSGTAYTDRTAAPFAIIDTLVTELEVVCTGQPDLSLPSLHVEWSINNTDTSGNIAGGQIGTSYYSQSGGQSKLYLLGKENVDSDEYDDHVVAHEFGHFLEDRLFRSDAPGGSHSGGDILDPRVAFSEGFGNGLSGMTFNDPIYVDTSGPRQADGFTFDVSEVPRGDDRGVYSEGSVMYLLWKLFDNRSPGHGSLDRIYNILRNFQKQTPALTSVVSFAAYYNQVYGGAAENLEQLWSADLATPWDALCVGQCSGTGDTADPFDSEDDIGPAYATTRHYPDRSASTFAAGFWQLYRPLVDGSNPATAHDTLNFGDYPSFYNKLGAMRWYRYTAAVDGTVTFSAGNLGSGGCTSDLLDMYVLKAGATLAYDETGTGPTAGCPTVTITAQAGETYVVLVYAVTLEESSYDMTVTR